MASLIETIPDDLQHAGTTAIFMFGTKSLDVNKLPIGAEFTCVYSPSGNKGWIAVRFMSSGEGYQEKAERNLEPAEVEHFERLVAASAPGWQ